MSDEVTENQLVSKMSAAHEQMTIISSNILKRLHIRWSQVDCQVASNSFKII